MCFCILLVRFWANSIYVFVSGVLTIVPWIVVHIITGVSRIKWARGAFSYSPCRDPSALPGKGVVLCAAGAGGASRLHDQGACACRCRPPPICSVQARTLRNPALGLPLPGKSRIVAIAPITLCCIGVRGLRALALARPRPSRALANYYPKRPPAMLVVFDHFRPELGGAVATTSSSLGEHSPMRGTTRPDPDRLRLPPLP